VVSLDFELYWGLRDKQPLEATKASLLGARQAIPRLLKLFADYGVHATWATVGFLFCDGREALQAAVPTQLPDYDNARLSPYSSLHNLGASEDEDPYHFAPSLIAKIINTPGQELSGHTLSHYYCLEPGQNRDAFAADLASAQRLAQSQGVTLRSLVLPRNQIEPGYLDLLPGLGIVAYRGAATGWMYRAASSPGDTPFARGARLIDAYTNISGYQGHARDALPRSAPVNIAASTFLRPYSPRLAWLDSLRLKRITTSMTHAARNGLAYHLWWHPHNMGLHVEESLALIEAILKHYSLLREQHGMVSLGMAELADSVLKNNRA
jgi:hypothetical protein